METLLHRIEQKELDIYNVLQYIKRKKRNGESEQIGNDYYYGDSALFYNGIDYTILTEREMVLLEDHICNSSGSHFVAVVYPLTSPYVMSKKHIRRLIKTNFDMVSCEIIQKKF